jgi:CheY-like chemotaxis protein
MGRRILMDAGYEVVTVNNGSAALKKIHESKPDLIVLDVYMPGYGGLEVCQRLKESADTARIPVLLSVGKMEPFKAEEARRVRADGHIVKPFEASELLAALTKLEDRIVPQAEPSLGRKGKSEKKKGYWRSGDPLAAAEETPTERVAYLSEAKKRHAHTDASTEAADDQASTAVANTDQAAFESAPAGSAARESAASEEFAVHESNVPAESDEQNQTAQHEPAQAESTQVEVTAAEPVTEIPAPVEAPAVEATAGAESISEEAAADVHATEVPAEPVAQSETPAVEEPAVAIASSPASVAHWVAENVALTVEEASLALEAEMQQAQAVSAPVATEPEASTYDQVTGSDPVVAQRTPEAQSAPTLENENVENENTEGAAFAAAASAGESPLPSAVSAQSANVAAGDPASVTESELPVASEAAAAWQNWQQIREAVMTPQKTAAIAESVAEMAQASLPAQEPAVQLDSVPSGATSAAMAVPAEEDNSINDIVDSVLADLKPRLMAEIAKKLAAKK